MSYQIAAFLDAKQLNLGYLNY